MRFSSGVAGVVVVVFALMGSVGVGYLFNGSSEPVTVTDYDYVTDVSGLYTYTPVTAYSSFSPAQNNYQYSDSYSTLGTYTSGITYTASASANLNPVITPSSGTQTVTGSVSSSNLTGTDARYVLFYHGTSSDVWGAQGKIIPLSNLLSSIGDYTTVTITVPAAAQETYNSTTLTVQHLGLWVLASGSDSDKISSAINNRVTAAGSANIPATTASASFTSGGTTMSTPVGTVSNITVNANGTASYAYTYNGTTETVTRSVSDVNLIVWGWNSSVTTISYSKTIYNNVSYLDANYGVSSSSLGSTVYWSDDYTLGAVSWMFRAPTTASEVTFTPHRADGTSSGSWTVSYATSTGWSLTYHDGTGTARTVSVGRDWPAVQVTQYYTGSVQVTPVREFASFTSYTLSTSTVYTGQTSNSGITYYSLVQTGSVSMRFAVTGTTVQNGTVPGAMYDASFDPTRYFPEYANVRVSFDSVVYVGTSVSVGSWTMATDTASFTGTFTLGSTDHTVDLTQPWSLTWNGGDLLMSFTPYRSAQTETVTLLEDVTVSSVALNGQWAVDTDLYTVGSHVEDRYQWNFGVWGIGDPAVFSACAIGLSALIAIVLKLAGVPFTALDFVVIFVGDAILWVIM